MEPDPAPKSKENPQRKSKTYFSIGCIFLVAMALFWSVDVSMVYILLGLAVYFLFLGFYHMYTVRNPYGQSKKSPHSSKQAADSSSSVFDELKNIFQTATGRQNPTNRGFAKPTTPEANRRVVTLVVVSIFAVFFIFFIGSVVFSSTSESEDDALVYYQIAEQNYWAENYDSALLNYRKAWKLDPEYPEAILGYGNVLAIRKEMDSAMIMFDRALTLNPDYKEADYSKAWSYYNQEKYDQSINILKPLIEKNPDYYDALLLMGDSYYSQRKYDEAIPWYENTYQNEGSRSGTLCHIMAYIYDTKGESEKAINLYREALSYDSSIVDVYKRLGELIPNEDGNWYRTQVVKLQQQQ